MVKNKNLSIKRVREFRGSDVDDDNNNDQMILMFYDNIIMVITITKQE